MCRVTVGGPGLEGFTVPQPAASVRVLMPSPDQPLVVPDWTGNEFRLPGGERPTIRTLTPRRFNPSRLELEVDVVIHEGGAASDWARSARPGDDCAVSGPARGYRIDPDAAGYVLAGDETAIPAISQLWEELPVDVPVEAYIEIAAADARLALPTRWQATVTWLDLPAGAVSGESLVAAVRDANMAPGARVWAAGEAASVQRIRRHLFEARALAREDATVRGYWKYGRAGGADND